MKVICKWIFKSHIQGIPTPQLVQRSRYIEEMKPDELMEMITSLLAQSETVRLIFEVENERTCNN